MTTLPLVALALLAQAPVPQVPVRIGGGIKEPRKVKDVAPEYPEEAVRAGLQGAVILECTLDLKGSVTEAKVVRGVPPLSDAALKAVRKWRYTPTLLDGKPVPVIMTITVNFKGSGRLQVDDLRKSLRSQNEHVRESAARWLADVRLGQGFDAGDMADVLQELEKLRASDPSEQVREAAARSIAQIQQKAQVQQK